ncbi:protein quaking-B-like isoform X2 [Cheilinus undulatus]|uniref:protein quaking-B-like isoform X2 n=1 Tax=Cheilinus undulatus TaxID=241271 RepID=UPI001BD5C907|nr:protein quaking-B-like isoform X2 [Cheilinus undulatus]
MVEEMEGQDKTKPGPDYLMQLMNDKKLMNSLPNICGIFQHLERLLDEEISRVRKDMYIDTLSVSGKINNLPEAVGPNVHLQEKLYVPTKEHPDFNFVGRILGPRGLTAKQLETDTGCKIMVRGRGSMRDRKKAEGEDSLKKIQLMELAILNGTYRDANIKPSSLALCLAASPQTPRMLSGPTSVMAPSTGLRAPAPTGPTLMPLIRQIQTILPNGTPYPAALMPGAGPESGWIYTTPYDHQYALAAPATILEYPLDSGGVLVKSSHPCSCDCSPQPHHHPHSQWSPAPTLLLRHAS